MFNYSLDSFFNRTDKDKFHLQLDQLLVECIKRKGTVNFKVGSKGDLKVYVGDARSEEKEVYIEGSAPFLISNDFSESLRGNILLPFFYDCNLVSIPYKRIFYIGRNDHCMSEFFVRNLCSNLILRSPLSIVSGRNLNWGGGLWKKMIQVYYWHLKRYFLGSMKEKPSKELVFANCIMPIMNSYNPRFEKDVQLVRHLFQNSSKEVRNDEVIKELIRCRNKVVEACY